MPSSSFQLIGPDGEPISKRSMNQPEMGENLKRQHMRQMQEFMSSDPPDYKDVQQKPMNKKGIALKALEGVAEGFSAFDL